MSEIIFGITKEDVIDMAEEMGIPKEAITDDILNQIKKGVEWGLSDWGEIVTEAINIALKG